LGVSGSKQVLEEHPENQDLDGHKYYKKRHISFLSGLQLHLHLLVILGAAAFVNLPGEIFLAEFCHSEQLSTSEFYRARPVQPSSPK